jgi:triphosphoribosyl-dephospho-CoA synthetase
MDALTLPDIIGMLAARALREEVCATPKPGLVDRHDSGAHSDMSLDTFLKSAQALEPYLTQFANIGFTSDCMPSGLFGRLCEDGKRAEDAMLCATGGANTHKGAIFSLGLACAAAGYCMRDGRAAQGNPYCLLSGYCRKKKPLDFGVC